MVDRSTDEEPSQAVDDERPPRMPRWVKAFVVVVAILVLLVVIVMVLGGGGHGPARHMSYGTPGEDLPRAGVSQDLAPPGGAGADQTWAEVPL